MKWQPIETAPKGQGIILTDGKHIVAIGAWFDGDWCFWEGDTDVVFWSEEGDREMCAELNYWVKPFGPTHWMPLPPPPETP